MTLGQRISTYRKQLGISQEALGERLGVSRQAVSKWETDAAAPDMTNLIALAREFGVSVAELTQTPEPRDVPVTAAPAGSLPRRGWWAALGALAVVILILLGVVIYWCVHADDGQVSKVPEPPAAAATSDTENTLPTQYPSTDFSLILDWTETGEFLELGEQQGDYPFGTSLWLDGEETAVTADDGSTVYTVNCLQSEGIRLRYSHIEEDGQPPRNIITLLETTLTKEISTPRGIHVGSSKAEVIGAYGSDLVYCMKEDGGDIVTEHDYIYAYQPKDAYSNSICFLMKDGMVRGIRVENMADLGNDAYAVNNISIFPIQRNGDPDYSNRQDLYMEPISETRKVYIAWNELVTNSNLSAEEIYADRWTIFSGLSTLDWQELGRLGATEYPEQTMEALMSWLEDQAPYSEPETFRLQMGVQSNLDGWLSESYSSLLSTAFFGNPTAFTKGLAYPGLEDTMREVMMHTAYSAELYPAELQTALDALDAAIESGSFTEVELGWAKLLRLYLITPIDHRNELPRTPAELE